MAIQMRLATYGEKNPSKKHGAYYYYLLSVCNRRTGILHMGMHFKVAIDGS